MEVLDKKIASSTILDYRHSLGFRFRRSNSKPKDFTLLEKEERYLFAINNINNDFAHVVFVDESTIQTNRWGFYHNRLPSSRPRVCSIKPRCVESIQMWCGISWNGPTTGIVNVFQLF